MSVSFKVNHRHYSVDPTASLARKTNMYNFIYTWGLDSDGCEVTVESDA